MSNFDQTEIGPTIISTSCFPLATTLTERLEELSAAGAAYVELGASPPVGADELAALTRSPLRLNVHNYFPPPPKPFVLNLASQSAEELELSLSMARDAIRMTAELGADFYAVHAGFGADIRPGSLGHGLEYANLVDLDTLRATMTTSLRQLCDAADGHGVAVAVENHVVIEADLVDGENRLLPFADPQSMAELIAGVDRANLGVLLDIGHLNVSARTMNFDPFEFVDAVRPHILGFHLSDNDGTFDQNLPLTEKTWALDLLAAPDMVRKPRVLEIRFETATEAVAHAGWLEARLQAAALSPTSRP